MASPKYRLPDELQNPELNYYIAFDIEPTETNIKKIEEALNKKRSTFARTVTPITTRLNELKDDIDKIMLEDAVLTDNNGTKEYVVKSGGRKIESDNAKKFFAERAIEMAKSICRSGFIEDSKIAEIAKRFYVTEKEVLDGIDSLLSQGVKLIKTAGAKREVAFSNFKKIESFLKTLGKKNLYDFSELPESSPTKALYDKQEEIYSVFSKKANDAKGKAAMDLSGIGKVVFKSDTARKEYDIYYKTKTNVWDLLSTFADSGLKTINDKIFIECLESFRNQAGLSADEAEKELYAYLDNFRLSREHADKIRIEVCPYDDCGKSYVYHDGIKSCPNCGKPLEIKCWNCGEVALFVSKTEPCAKCGITAQNKTEFDKAQQNFGGLLKKIGVSDIELANALNTMENVYPAYDTLPNSFVAKAISVAKKQIEEYKEKQAAKNAINEKYVKEIEKLIVQKKYCQAEALIKQLRVEDPSYDTKEFDQKVQTAKTKAQQFIDSANAFLKKNDEANAIDSCCKALEVCADYTAAIQMIKNYPPKQPGKLVARANRKVVKLDWQIVGDQKAVTYTVIRKVGSAPTNETDGEVLESDLTINFFEDISASSAVAYYYSVFASRGGINSTLSSTDTPTMLFLDVSSVHQEKIGDVIKATWQIPDNVQSVEVYRKSGAVPPTNKNDGEQIAVSNNTSFTDSNLTEDKNSYLIICKYTCLGKEYYSQGVRVSYKTFRIPRKLSNVRVTSAGGETDFNFSSDEPINGNVKLYYSKKHIEYQYGEADDKSNFVKKCKDLREIDTIVLSNNRVRFSAPEKSIIWLYPVCANEQLFVINEPILVNTIVGIDAINVINKNGNINIEGNLNPSVRNIVAVINNTSFVETVDGEGEIRTCTSDMFFRDKGFYLSLKPGLYYITLFAEFYEAGNKFYSRATRLPEVIDNREKLNVEYALNYTLSVTSSFVITVNFKCSDPITLPEIDLVSGYPQPLNKNSGVVIGTLKGGVMKKKLFKDGYYYSEKIKVSSANSTKDKITMFFHSDNEKRLRLKGVNTIK